MDNSIQNKEGYLDPTTYQAMKNIDSEDRFYKLLNMIFSLCELAGFRLEGRITLVDKKTGRIWR